MKTTKLMRQTANTLRVYRIACNESINMDIIIYLSNKLNDEIKKIQKKENIKFHSDVIKLLEKILEIGDYE